MTWTVMTMKYASPPVDDVHVLMLATGCSVVPMHSVWHRVTVPHVCVKKGTWATLMIHSWGANLIVRVSVMMMMTVMMRKYVRLIIRVTVPVMTPASHTPVARMRSVMYKVLDPFVGVGKDFYVIQHPTAVRVSTVYFMPFCSRVYLFLI